MNVTVYSDGGTNGMGHGAGATILDIDTGDKKERYQVVSFLGKATNNEGEIFSGLVGFYLAMTIYQKPFKQITWVSDSQYAIKSATQYIHKWLSNGWKTANKEPVKNQGLWRTFLCLSQGVDIKVEHVKGHSGHVENEACDLAVNWIRDNLEVLNVNSCVEIPGADNWIIFDARDALDFIRGIEIEVSKEELLEVFGPVKSGLTSKPSTKKAPKSKAPMPINVTNDLKELTKGYIDAIRSLENVNDFLKTENELKKVLLYLKRWSGVK